MRKSPYFRHGPVVQRPSIRPCQGRDRRFESGRDRRSVVCKSPTVAAMSGNTAALWCHGHDSAMRANDRRKTFAASDLRGRKGDRRIGTLVGVARTSLGDAAAFRAFYDEVLPRVYSYSSIVAAGTRPPLRSSRRGHSSPRALRGSLWWLLRALGRQGDRLHVEDPGRARAGRLQARLEREGRVEVTRIEYAFDADPGRERSWTRSDIAFRWWSKRRMPRWSEAGACR